LPKGNAAAAKVTVWQADEVCERGVFRKVNRTFRPAVMADGVSDRHPGTGGAVVQIEQYRSVSKCPWVS